MKATVAFLLPVIAVGAIGCDEEGAHETASSLAAGTARPQAEPGDWCAEHGVPESMCSKCNPSLIPGFQQAGDWCAEHGFPESVCPRCNPMPSPAGAPSDEEVEGRTVRFRSSEIEERAGIRTSAAVSTTTAPTVDCAARIAFHGDRVADVRAIVPGIVRAVRIELGQNVERGAPLFELESTRVGEIQAALQTARERARTAESNLARQRQLREGDIASARQVELAEQELATAEAEARAAQSTLRMAGARQTASSGRYVLTAPIAGSVVRRPGVMGVLATESTSLATIADTSVVWALCDVPEAEASRLAVGQVARVVIEGGREPAFDGQVTWIAAEVDLRSRTVTARVEVPNPDGRLRANQFARATVETGAASAAVSVPRAAVQRIGVREVVFVRTAAGVYEPRIVRRRGGGDVVQIEGDISPGDEVVTTGAVLLRTEVMPGSIGAGCCDVEPPAGE